MTAIPRPQIIPTPAQPVAAPPPPLAAQPVAAPPPPLEQPDAHANDIGHDIIGAGVAAIDLAFLGIMGQGAGKAALPLSIYCLLRVDYNAPWTRAKTINVAANVLAACWGAAAVFAPHLFEKEGTSIPQSPPGLGS